jgi:hypothetical protein
MADQSIQQRLAPCWLRMWSVTCRSHVLKSPATSFNVLHLQPKSGIYLRQVAEYGANRDYRPGLEFAAK